MSKNIMKPAVGDSVIMPEPNETDSWQFGNFVGVVAGFRNNNFVVQDQDGDCFEIEQDRVTLIEE